MNDWLIELLPEGTPAGQERAVICDDELITVGAGAGTGKTWVLSTRFARLLFSDRECLPQNILTLTFTEAAAREMQERIRKRTLELIAHRPAEEQSGWQSVREGFDETWISTIHSFAARLIRESGLSLDIDPGSGIVSAPQEEAFWGTLERSLESLDLASLSAPYGDRILNELARNMEENPDSVATLEKWTPDVIRELVQNTAELHASLGHSWQMLMSWADAALREDDPQVATMSDAVLELLRPVWSTAWRLWREILFDFENDIWDARDQALKKTDAKKENPIIPLVELMDRWMPLLHDQEKNNDSNVQRLFFLDLCTNLKSNNSKLFGAIRERLGQTVSEWREAQKKKFLALSEVAPEAPLSENERRLRAFLLRLTAFAWGTWEASKRRRGLLSFTDMIRFAGNSITMDTVTKGFRHILIDEFQDTDPLQEAMIRELRSREGAKLFLVGDPKQAIYRFRHADLTLFADYMLQSRVRGGDVALNVSFRTRDALLHSINSLFAHIWKDGLGVGERMSSLKFEPLAVPESFPPERELPTVTPFTVLLSPVRGRSTKEARFRLAVELGRTFARWHEEKRTIWDRKERILRPIRWKDFAVLTPTRAEYEILEAAFEEENIPVAFEKSMSWFSRGEVTDVIDTLRAAAFPTDETALAGWLSSPFSGVPRGRVTACLSLHATVVRDRVGTPLFDIVREQLPEAAERLEYLRHLGGLKGPSTLLSFLLEDRRWLASFEAARRPRVLSNINRAISLARQYENGISSSLAGCAQWLSTALRAGRTLEEPEWMNEEADAVRVTTVHASKGLEFPVVAVMRTERRVGGGGGFASVLPSKTIGIALSAVPDMMKSADEAEESTKSKPRTLRWEKALELQSTLEESSRLFYVAATRAQDALILCGLIGEAKNKKKSEEEVTRKVAENSWLSWTLDWLGTERNCDWRDLEGPPLVYTPEDGSDAPRTLRKFPGEERRAPSRPCVPLSLPTNDDIVLQSFSATSYALFEWCPFAWRRRHRQGLDLRWEMPDGEGDAPGGSLLGTLAHWILAQWNMKEETLGSWLDDPNAALRLPAYLRDTWRENENREALRTWLGDLARSDEGRAVREAAQNDTLRREASFCALADDLCLVGAIDALRRDTGGWWSVRDYKITLSDNAPEELYRAQLGFYALVVKLLAEKQELPFEGVDVGLVFLREGGRLGETRHFPRDNDWAGMQKQVWEAARTAAQGPWIPRREHCRFCPWKKDCPER